jgi:hypothetical protein
MRRRPEPSTRAPRSSGISDSSSRPASGRPASARVPWLSVAAGLPGVAALMKFLDSKMEYVRASVYELGDRFRERFDLVIFWGVLYHLRHPLLALDNFRTVTAGEASVETVVRRRASTTRAFALAVRCYRRDELSTDPSNWFAPTVAALEDWCISAGFAIERLCGRSASLLARC